MFIVIKAMDIGFFIESLLVNNLNNCDIALV